MMHLIHRIKQDRGDKHPFFNVVAVHVEESYLFVENEAECKNTKDRIVAFAKQCDVPLYIIPLETIFLLSNSSFSLKIRNGELECEPKLFEMARKNLTQCLKTTSTSTSKEDLVRFFREKLLGYLFKNIHFLHTEGEKTEEFKCVKLATASSASRLAIQLIADTCKGKGFSVAAQIALEAPALEEVEVVRPMREFVGKEIASYNFKNNISPIFVPTFGTKGGAKFSINQLCEDFIEGLQAEFGHTIHTLLKSGSKLVIPQDSSTESSSNNKQLYRCSLCSSFISPSESINLIPNPPLLSTTKSETQCESCSCGNNNSGVGSCHDSVQKMEKEEDIPSSLCHGCRKLHQEMKTPSLLPLVIKQASIKTQTSKALRSQIEEFLLEQ